MTGHKEYNFSVKEVSEVYAGPGGQLWELLMGEQIHVGGAEETDVLARKAGIEKGKDLILLDICSALGGPARHLAGTYGIKVVGVDITPEMVAEARKRTEDKPYSDLIEYRIGSALDLPSEGEMFDIVWGQDAWCYVRDKGRLISEAARVLKTGGTLAFTDWIWGKTAVDKDESDFLMTFMVFPNMENLEGYDKLIEDNGLELLESEDLGDDFATKMDEYLAKLQGSKDAIVKGFGEELYQGAEDGIIAWQKAAHAKKISRARWIAKKK